jgi:hypothetical protein
MASNPEDRPSDGVHPEGDRYQIQIDRVHYTVTSDTLTGAELRALPSPSIGPDRDLFEVVPGGTDRKIGDADTVRMRNGLRFFSAPSHINPGGGRS